MKQLPLSIRIFCFLAGITSIAPCALNGAENIPFVVKLPFPPGKQYKINQGNFGNFSHNNAQFAYAWDFDLPEGSEVTAAAPGRVVELKQDGNMGGGSRMFASSTNYIIIDHGSGHFSKYMHLKYGSAKVAAGDIVKTGQVIALSGATGFATSPHLHFQINDYRGISQPARFMDFSPHGGNPQEGDVCRSGPLLAAAAQFKDSTPLPKDAFAKNAIQLTSTVPACLFEEGHTYHFSGKALRAGSSVLLLVMPRSSFDTVCQSTSAIGPESSFDCALNFKPSSPNHEVGGEGYRLTLVIVNKDGSYKSKINTPIYLSNGTTPVNAPSTPALAASVVKNSR